MYCQIIQSTEIPKSNKYNTYPTNYIITLVNENKKAKFKLSQDAKKLLEHIEIVREARKLYSEGKVIAWEQFIKNESK